MATCGFLCPYYAAKLANRATPNHSVIFSHRTIFLVDAPYLNDNLLRQLIYGNLLLIESQRLLQICFQHVDIPFNLSDLRLLQISTGLREKVYWKIVRRRSIYSVRVCLSRGSGRGGGGSGSRRADREPRDPEKTSNG